MHPISIKFLAKQVAVLLAVLGVAFVTQDHDRYGVLITLAAAAFIYGTARVAKHVVNLNRKHRYLALFVIVAVQSLALVFTALFLSASYLWIPFLCLETIGFIYFAIIK
jgi:hypothetical protein